VAMLPCLLLELGRVAATQHHTAPHAGHVWMKGKVQIRQIVVVDTVSQGSGSLFERSTIVPRQSRSSGFIPSKLFASPRRRAAE
jgi:hypothetical protein